MSKQRATSSSSIKLASCATMLALTVATPQTVLAQTAGEDDGLAASYTIAEEACADAMEASDDQAVFAGEATFEAEPEASMAEPVASEPEPAVGATFEETVDAGSAVEDADAAAMPDESEAAAVDAAQEAPAADANNQVSYNYNAQLYDQQPNENGTITGGQYPGVYAVKLSQNEATKENPQTIGIPSIADATLADAPTEESPAIIGGAAVGYEKKIGPVQYEIIEERVAPYTYFRYSIMQETAQDGTTHAKLSGFDGTYVIVRCDVSELLQGYDPLTSYLHVKQEQNNALLVAIGIEGTTFSDGLGNKTGAYKFSDLYDTTGKDQATPYFDVCVFSTASIVSGADSGKANMPTGDVPLHFYVDDVADYNPDLTFDPHSTDPNHTTNCLAKFFDDAKAALSKLSNFVVKGADLALETIVENSAGANKNSGPTYWSLSKSLEKPYYDQQVDSDANDPNCGRTVKLMSEVPVITGLAFTGSPDGTLRKRTLDVNSFDIQIANNTTPDTSTYTAGLTLENAWLTVADRSNTTGAELAVGNNARMQINRGGKLIIDETCQLEIEWDGATATPTEGQAQTPDTLNNGLLDLREGGELVNNGVITIEGTEGKPYQPEAGQQAIDSAKGKGEMLVQRGATLTNNGSLMVYGTLYNMGTIVNNGKYDENPIVSNDPDRGTFTYHRGIVLSWKDDVTQNNVTMGELVNGMDRNGTTSTDAMLLNRGDIVLVPGKLTNYAMLRNERGAHIYLCAATEAIIPVEATAAAPTIVSKRITLNPPVASVLENYGTIINYGSIMPASVEILDNTSLGKLTPFGSHPELFTFLNHGKVINHGYIYGWGDDSKDATPVGSRAAAAIKLPKTGESTSWFHVACTLAVAGFVALAQSLRLRLRPRRTK